VTWNRSSIAAAGPLAVAVEAVLGPAVLAAAEPESRVLVEDAPVANPPTLCQVMAERAADAVVRPRVAHGSMNSVTMMPAGVCLMCFRNVHQR
jgi:hypothetical protein